MAWSVIQDTWCQQLFKICPVGVFLPRAKIISLTVWQEAALALRSAAEQRHVCCSCRTAYTAGDCVCLGKQQQQSRGLWETAIRTNAVPLVKQVEVQAACLGRPPPRQSHFPKVAVTHGAPSSTVYVTDLVKGIMTWHLTFLFGGGRWGERSWI